MRPAQTGARRTATTFPSGVGVTMTAGYDNSSRLTSIVAKKGTTTLTSFSYVYTNGQAADTSLRQSVTDKDGNKTSYGYDGLARLVDATTLSSTQAPVSRYQYAYDANANMTSKTVTLGTGAPTTTAYTYNAANELSNTGYAFDGNGQQSAGPGGAAFTYNVRDQTTTLNSGSSTEDYTYAGNGQSEKLSKTSGGSTTTFANNGLGLSTRNNGSPSYYLRDPEGNLVLLRYPCGTNLWCSYYYLVDGLGSVAATVDSSGAVATTYKYDPYGGDTGTTGTIPSQPWRYAGAYYSTNLQRYSMGLRWYDPSVGRFTQTDSLWDPLETHGWNPYSYTGDDPVNFTDPSGMAVPPCEAGHTTDPAACRPPSVARRFAACRRKKNCNWNNRPKPWSDTTTCLVGLGLAGLAEATLPEAEVVLIASRRNLVYRLALACYSAVVIKHVGG